MIYYNLFQTIFREGGDRGRRIELGRVYLAETRPQLEKWIRDIHLESISDDLEHIGPPFHLGTEVPERLVSRTPAQLSPDDLKLLGGTPRDGDDSIMDFRVTEPDGSTKTVTFYFGEATEPLPPVMQKLSGITKKVLYVVFWPLIMLAKLHLLLAVGPVWWVLAVFVGSAATVFAVLYIPEIGGNDVVRKLFPIPMWLGVFTGWVLIQRVPA